MEHQTKLQWIASATQGIFTAETSFGTVYLQEGTQKTNWHASLQMPWQVAATPAGNSVSAAMQRAQQAMLEYEARCKNHPLHWTKLAHKATGLQNLEVRADTPFGFVDIACKRNPLTEVDEYTIDFWGNTLEHPDLQDLNSAQAAASNIYVELIRKEATKLGVVEEQSQARRQTGVSNEAWAAYVEMLEPSAQWLEVCRPAGQQLKVVVHDGAQSYDATVDGSDLLRLYASVSGVGEWLVDLCLPVADYVADKGTVLAITMAPAQYSGAEQSIVGWAEWGDGTEPFGAQTCVFGKVRGGYDAAV